MSKHEEEKNKQYLENLLSNDNKGDNKQTNTSNKTNSTVPSIEYSNINIDILPAGRFYPSGTKISIRAAKVKEVQAYSMVNDDNFVDVTEKMNELLARNIHFEYPNGEKGSYKDIKDADRIFLIFMIRELTFQGGNTLTKEVTCKNCDNVFTIPFRATPNGDQPSTFELHKPNEKLEKIYDKETKTYNFVYNNVSWKLAPPTIGIQEDFFENIKKDVQADLNPNVAFMKIMPFLLHDRSSMTSEEIKEKLKEFGNMDDLYLFSSLDEIVNNMTVGIKGLKMKCNECGQEVHTDLTFPFGASSLFKFSNVLDNLG